MKKKCSAALPGVLIIILCFMVWGCNGGKMNPAETPAPVPAPRPQPKPVPPPAPVVLPPPLPPEPEPAGTRDPGAPLPQQHHWDSLLQRDGEARGYGMYTYVLFNRQLDLRASLDPEILQRYQKLLNVIVATTLSSTDVGEIDAAEKQLTNLFMIPGTVRGKLPSLDNYNAVLAMRYLDEIGKLTRADNPEVADRLMSRPGPFLVSTLKPVSEIDDRQTTLLYIDLSATNPAAMTEIVAAYKLRLSQNPLNEAEHFAPLRLALLNLVLNADDNITLVKAALAHWVPD